MGRQVAPSVATVFDADQEILDRVARGDDRALGALYDRHGAVMYSLACSIVKEPADAEEVVADAFLQLWKSGGHDRNRGSVGAYLAVITRSRALDKIRAGQRRQRAEGDAASQDPEGIGFALTVAPSEPPDSQMERRQRGALAREALAALPAEQREAITLAFFRGYTHSEIAQQTATPLGTVKTRIRDGMSKLRTALAGPAGGSA